MKVLVTGADGFIGAHIRRALSAAAMECLPITRKSTRQDLYAAAAQADAVIHLAGVNRPKENESYDDNQRMAEEVVSALVAAQKKVPVIYTSSTQVERDNPYGISKKHAEDALLAYGAQVDAPVYIYRLPNVFGPGARPNYNSAVATFCHRIARDEAIEIHDPAAVVTLVHAPDVAAHFMNALRGEVAAGMVAITPTYTISVGDMAAQIRAFREGNAQPLAHVHPALAQALYQTYRSAQPEEAHAH